MKKHTYEQPLAEIFELNLSANVLQDASPTFSTKGTELMTTDDEEEF